MERRFETGSQVVRRAALLSALSVALGLPLSAEAKKFYKYRDASGRWNYTDNPPRDGALDVEVRQLRINTPRSKIHLVKRGGEERSRLVIINEYHGPVQLELSLADGHNLAIRPKLPRRYVVPAISERLAVTLQAQDPRRPWTYDIRVRTMLGDPRAEHRPPGPYRPPFAAGQSFPISQGFEGVFSHRSEDSRFAVDIAMPEGSAVHAARGGVVMDLAKDFMRGGRDFARYVNRANMIRILHDDGTMGVYAHLQLESVQVVTGARVSTGQLLAYSGNTGYTSGPHLHFVIQKNAGMKLISLPFLFSDRFGRAVRPEPGKRLRVAPNIGKQKLNQKAGND